MTATITPARRGASGPGTARRPALIGFFGTTIGKKVLMAGTGLLLIAFVVLHMVGNLKYFLGAATFNHYGAWLRTIGEPALPHGVFLWLQRATLLGALVLHFWTAVSLTLADRRARPVRYQARGRGRAGYAAWTMRWGGVVVLLFIVWHILDLTLGAVNPAGGSSEPSQRIAEGFGRPVVVAFYILSVSALSTHLAHGLWSAAQTLGLRVAGARYYRVAAVALSAVVAIGYLSVPVAVLAGYKAR